MHQFIYNAARDIAIAINGGSLPSEVLNAEPSTDPVGDLNLAFNTASAEILNSLNLPGIPDFRFG